MVRGTLQNRPPLADASNTPDNVECSSPKGAKVTLDGGASTDPDGDSLSHGWHLGPSILANPLGDGQTLDVQQSFGTQRYTLAATDSRFQIDRDSARVEVVDTTPPDVKNFSFEGPPCLWPPNHKYVVLRVGRDFQSVVEDTCDPNPQIVVRNVSSDQPDNARGDGSGGGVAATRKCMQDVWLEDVSIECGCIAPNSPPECEHDDCVKRDFRWFRKSGPYVDGSVLISETAGTFSTFTEPEIEQWEMVDKSHVRLTDDDGSEDKEAIECDREEIVIGALLFKRSSSGRSRAFEAAYETDEDYTWRGEPLSP